MRLTFLTCLSEPRVVYKEFDNRQGTYHEIENAAVYQACSMMAPEFVVNFNADLLRCNYVTTSNNEFGNRCYFIKEHVVLPGGRLVVRCAIDVLYTWREYIGRCTANVIRQESEEHKVNPSRFIFDANMMGKSNTHTDNIPFKTNPFIIPAGQPSYVMTVLGGIQNNRPENRGDSNETK